MLKKALGAALGVLLAGAIIFLVRLAVISYFMKEIGNLTQQMLPIKPPADNNQIVHIPKTKEQIVHENSKQAYVQVKKEVDSFKAQYKKPPECYDMKDDATRIHCANEFIRARKAYEALHN
jgi:predicted PurR-regulated permease PerM